MIFLFAKKKFPLHDINIGRKSGENLNCSCINIQVDSSLSTTIIGMKCNVNMLLYLCSQPIIGIKAFETSYSDIKQKATWLLPSRHQCFSEGHKQLRDRFSKQLDSFSNHIKSYSHCGCFHGLWRGSPTLHGFYHILPSSGGICGGCWTIQHCLPQLLGYIYILVKQLHLKPIVLRINLTWYQYIKASMIKWSGVHHPHSSKLNKSKFQHRVGGQGKRLNPFVSSPNSLSY